jgi:hypothetical protein
MGEEAGHYTIVTEGGKQVAAIWPAQDGLDPATGHDIRHDRPFRSGHQHCAEPSIAVIEISGAAALRCLW